MLKKQLFVYSILSRDSLFLFMVMRTIYKVQHQITQHKFLLNKKQFCLFIITIFTLSLPFILLAANGSIVNESGLILILPVMAGLPWVLLFLIAKK